MAMVIRDRVGPSAYHVQAQAASWPKRRSLGIGPTKELFVIACMDERIPVEEALGLELGDAHIFRNAGGSVTDDALRSAMLSIRFNGTKKIIVINHTNCGMSLKPGHDIVKSLKDQGIDTDSVQIDESLDELQLQDQSMSFAKWLDAFEDVDAFSKEQVQFLKDSPLIPDDVEVEGYVWDVATMSLRKAR